jgi:hypothetical protein
VEWYREDGQKQRVEGGGWWVEGGRQRVEGRKWKADGGGQGGQRHIPSNR